MPLMSDGLARGALWDVVVVIGVLTVSSAVSVLALATASGVVPLGGGDFSTEFISGWWWLAFLLVPVPGVCARPRSTTAAVAMSALVVPHFVAAAVCVARYRTSGWAQGLEVFAFLHPVLLTVVAGALTRGIAARRRTQPR